MFSFYEYFTEVLYAAFCKILIKYFQVNSNNNNNKTLWERIFGRGRTTGLIL